MLIDEPLVLNNSMNLILNAIGGGRSGKRLTQGIYQISHFGCSRFLEGYSDYENLNLTINEFGVCDTTVQILEQCPELIQNETRQFVITLTPIIKKEQSSWGGWRWHKWGPYIGIQSPTHEYLYDEPLIEQVLVYHIYEKKR